MMPELKTDVLALSYKELAHRLVVVPLELPDLYKVRQMRTGQSLSVSGWPL
jgi:hypothetical protein